MLEEFKKGMMITFSISDLEIMKVFLEIEVTQNSNGVFITQHKYIEELLSTLPMQQYKSALRQLAINEKLHEDSSEECSDPWVFRSIIGRLLYVTHTRHDICFSVNFLPCFMSHPRKNHLSAAKQVVRYLARTRRLGLWYNYGDARELEAFSDSD